MTIMIFYIILECQLRLHISHHSTSNYRKMLLNRGDEDEKMREDYARSKLLRVEEIRLIYCISMASNDC
jgi:hypothetical protein